MIGARSGPRWGLARVRGASMEPTLRAGDRLLVRYGGRPAPGRVAVVDLPDGTVAVKRLEAEQPDGWWVTRDNPREGVDSWTLGRAVAGVRAVVVLRVWPRPRRV